MEQTLQHMRGSTKVGTPIFTEASEITYKTSTVEAALDEIDTIKTQITNLGKSVSDGKSSVASAITAKGVTTASDATFATMATNIGKIKSNPTLQSKSASLSTSSQTIKADSGYDGLSQVTVPAVSGNAAQSDVLSGKTFNSATAGIEKSGSMENKGGTTVDASAVTSDDNYTYLTVPTAGYYNTSSKVRTLNSNLENLDVSKISLIKPISTTATSINVENGKQYILFIVSKYAWCKTSQITLTGCTTIKDSLSIGASDDMNEYGNMIIVKATSNVITIKCGANNQGNVFVVPY